VCGDYLSCVSINCLSDDVSLVGAVISVMVARIRSRDGAINMLGTPISRSGEDVSLSGSAIS